MFPVVKLAQNGVDPSTFNLMMLIGSAIPLIALGTCIGIYAIIVESKETDMSRLFRICISLPALIVNLGTGKSIETLVKADVPASVIISGKQLVCKPAGEFAKGIRAVTDALSNKNRIKYWVITKEVLPGADWAVLDGTTFYVVQKSTDVKPAPPPRTFLFDCVTCQIIEANQPFRTGTIPE
jgi:hypothetical protein